MLRDLIGDDRLDESVLPSLTELLARVLGRDRVSVALRHIRKNAHLPMDQYLRMLQAASETMGREAMRRLIIKAPRVQWAGDGQYSQVWDVGEIDGEDAVVKVNDTDDFCYVRFIEMARANQDVPYFPRIIQMDKLSRDRVMVVMERIDVGRAPVMPVGSMEYSPLTVAMSVHCGSLLDFLIRHKKHDPETIRRAQRMAEEMWPGITRAMGMVWELVEKHHCGFDIDSEKNEGQRPRDGTPVLLDPVAT